MTYHGKKKRACEFDKVKQNHLLGFHYMAGIRHVIQWNCAIAPGLVFQACG